MTADGHWCVARAAAVDAREWDGEVVVYDADSASTHLLNPIAGSVFMALRASQRAMTGQQIAAVVFGSGDADGDEVAALVGVLTELERIGIVRPAGTAPP